MDRQESTASSSDKMEVGSPVTAVTRSLNHLLNFQLEKAPASPLVFRCKQQVRVLTKEEYALANFRFIVKPNRTYVRALASVEQSSISWDEIEEVVFPTEEDISCPICLGKPIAGKISKCGHIFCYPCILHYLSTSPRERWHRCPICFDAISVRDLHSVSEYHYIVYKPGDIIIFRFMERSKNSSFPMFAQADTGVPVLWDTLPPCNSEEAVFSQFSVCTDDHLRELLERERTDLLTSLGSGDESDGKFIEKAMQLVTARADDWNMAHSDGGSGVSVDFIVPAASSANTASADSTSMVYNSEADKDRPPAIADEDGTDRNAAARSRTSSTTADNGTENYFFYQAADGQRIFLHPFQMKALRREFGDYSRMPLFLELKCVSVEAVTFEPELQKKYKFLSHLPDRCTIQLCEVDLRRTVSPESFQTIEAEVRRRQSARSKQKKREKSLDRRNAKRQDHHLSPSLLATPVDVEPTAVEAATQLSSALHYPSLFDSDTIADSQSASGHGSHAPGAAGGAWEAGVDNFPSLGDRGDANGGERGDVPVEFKPFLGGWNSTASPHAHAHRGGSMSASSSEQHDDPALDQASSYAAAAISMDQFASGSKKRSKAKNKRQSRTRGAAEADFFSKGKDN